MEPKTIDVFLADDHTLIRTMLTDLVNNFSGYKVKKAVPNGKALIEYFVSEKPESGNLVLMDLSMPVMDGVTATRLITKLYPEVKVLALSMHDDEDHILNMLGAGARGYLLKTCSPRELKDALEGVVNEGYYFTPDLKKAIHQNASAIKQVFLDWDISTREGEFLRLACTELTYKEIAEKMNVAKSTIETYRGRLFKKLEINNRVELVIFALAKGIVKREDLKPR